jgi:RNA polymerase sigma-70 factor (ECF subfamily)
VEASGIPSRELIGLARRQRPGRPWSEARLIREAQRGSADAMEELFSRHWESCRRTALLVTGDRAAAEDIAQDAFLAAVRALGRFDVSRPLAPWLHRIVVNRAIDWSRARSARAEVAAEAAGNVAAVQPSLPFAPAPDSELGAALMCLGVEQRAVIVLRFLLDLTPGEIAHALDVPRGTINSRLRRGLDALGSRITKDLE